MTFEERLAALGVETRDFVPSDEHCKNLYDKFYAEAERICKTMSVELDGAFMVSLLLVAVAKRDIIIDRAETRIVNLTGELNYLKHSECRMCMPFDQTLRRRCGECAVYKGIPDEWSIDDGYSHQEKFEAYEQELAYEQKTGRKLFDWLESWPKSI